MEGHRHSGIFIARGKEDALVTKNMVPGESVYGEKRVAVEGQDGAEKVEYRVWNPFRSKLAAAVLAGVDNIHIKPGGQRAGVHARAGGGTGKGPRAGGLVWRQQLMSTAALAGR